MIEYSLCLTNFSLCTIAHTYEKLATFVIETCGNIE